MAEEPVPAVRRHAAIVVTALVGFVIVLLLGYSVGGMLADRERNRMLEAWAGSLGSFEQILERYPVRETNDAARRVEELSAGLGIDIVHGRREERPSLTAEADDRYRQAKRVVNDYADAQLRRDDPRIDSPRPEVVSFLEEHRQTLDALRTDLLEEDAPSWALDLRKPFTTPVPNLIGFSNLQRLLMSEVMSQASAGEFDGALSTLDAAWRINQALQEIPILTAQLIALGVSRQQLAALRHIEHVPRWWRERIHEHDYRAVVLTAMQLEGWGWIHALDPRSYDESTRTNSSLLYTVARPYVSYCVTGVGEEWRRRLVQLSEVDRYCDRDLAVAEIDLQLKPPSWNLLGQITFGSLDDVPRRVARYELDRELTVKLLELKWAREDLGGRWPESLPGIEQSQTCPEDHWVYQATPGGGASLAFSRPVEWKGLRGARLPLNYVARP